MKNHFSVMIAVLTSLRIGAVRLVGSKEADTKRTRDNMVSRLQTMVAAFAFAVFVAAAVSAQGNPEAATIKNPRPANPESIAAGKQSFRLCASCHGINAEGGPGNDLIPAAPDLTDDKWDHGSTDGEIFDAIKNGIPPDFNMVPFKDKLKDEEIWNVVNYLRSIAKKR